MQCFTISWGDHGFANSLFIYITYICQYLIDYINGLMTLDCLPGLSLV